MSKVLSVSIAAYNVEKYLENAVDSIINGGVINDVEVLIVNDGSKDNTAAIAKKYVEEYPNSVFLIDKENGGYGSTINSSLAFAKGKYFKILDGDDWFDSKNLIDFVSFLKDCDVDMVLTQYTHFYEPQMTTELVEQEYKYNIITPVSQLTKYSMHAAAVKTECIKNEISITEHCFYTDVEYFLKIVNCCDSFISIPLNIYCYRLGREGQSMSFEGILKHLDNHDMITRKAIRLVNTSEKLINMRECIIRMASRNYGYLLLAYPNKQNFDRFMSYRDFIKQNCTGVLKYLNTKEKATYNFPHIFYKPYSCLKRRRYKVNKIKG